MAFTGKAKESEAITTLDGVFWDKQEILSKMQDDKFYFGYLGENALSSSACGKLLESPRAYRNSLLGSSEVRQEFRDGSLFHYRLLEPEKWDSLQFVDVQTKAAKTYKLAVEKYGEDNVYTEKEKYNADMMADAYLGNSKVAHYLQGTRKEVGIIGMIAGFPFRGKADILGSDFIVDLKTTGKPLSSFKYSANTYGYDMQCFIYCYLFGISYKDFKFVVINKNSHQIGIFDCSKEFYHRGEYKTMEAIQIYKDYFVDRKKEVDEFYLYDVL